MTSTGKVLCKATTKSGAPCQAYALEGGEYCFMHEPSRAAERALARSKGGRARHGRAIGSSCSCIHVGTPTDVLAVVTGALEDLHALENSISRARAIGYLASVAIKVFEVTEIEQRLAALEGRLSDE